MRTLFSQNDKSVEIEENQAKHPLLIPSISYVFEFGARCLHGNPAPALWRRTSTSCLFMGSSLPHPGGVCMLEFGTVNYIRWEPKAGPGGWRVFDCKLDNKTISLIMPVLKLPAVFCRLKTNKKRPKLQEN